MIYINSEQSKRLGQLLTMGVPLPIALPIAMNPEEAAQAIQDGTRMVASGIDAGFEAIAAAPATVRKASAYNKRYKAAFKKVAPKYKTKGGKWRKGGFKAAVKEAHRIAGGKKR